MGATTVVGQANVNTTGTANTSIGNSTGTVAVTGASVGVNGGAVRVASTSGGTSVTGTNTSGNGVTVQGTGTTQDVSILSGNGASYVNLSGNNAVMQGGNSLTMGGGGTNLALTSNGARLLNSTTGGAVRLTGILDGTNAYDAVNRRQLNQAFGGIAGAMALNGIPSPRAGSNYAIGVGGGYYMGQSAMAVGAKANIGEGGVGSIGISYNATGQMAAMAGFGWSW